MHFIAYKHRNSF